MLDQLMAKSEGALANDVKPELEKDKKYTYEVLDQAADGAVAHTPAPKPATWSFSNIPLFPSDQSADDKGSDCRAKAIAFVTGHDVRTCSDNKCALCAHASGKDSARDGGGGLDLAPVANNKCTANNEEACNCTKCSGANDLAATDEVANDFTFTFLSRGSYGETSANFTRPSCAPQGTGAVMQAGAANPVVTVFPNGTYRVRRNDGVEQTATCTRSAAGLAATTAHEGSHAAGARRGVTTANAAQNLPRVFGTGAECATASPGILTAWNAIVDPVWQNEITHGPGTNPPTAATFAQENAAGSCTFA